MERVVIVGAGLAGARTAEALRTRGFTGAVTLLGAEDHPPYDRPPLSKAVLTGRQYDTTLATDFAALDVELAAGVRATGLDTAGVHAIDGVHPFDHLVIATGATPRRLPGGGPQRTLRTAADAHELRGALRPGRSIAIVGAGWIGAEVATAAAAAGCRVTVVEAAGTPLAGAVPAAVAARTAGWYREAGVRLLLDTGVAEVTAGGLALAAGGELPADEVVTATGVRPAVDWLVGSPVALAEASGRSPGAGRADGVITDGALRADAPGLPPVYAAGDCAAFWSVRYGARIRVEHWDTALNAPEVVAAGILGEPARYDPVPYFWSEQFGRMVQFAGRSRPGDRLVWRGDPESPRWSACWLAGETMTAVLAVGRPRDLVQGRRLMARGAAFDAAALADPDVRVRDAVGAEPAGRRRSTGGESGV